MSKHLYLVIIAWLIGVNTTQAQNADQLYYNTFALQFHYKAASFVVDTPFVASAPQAFLLWSANVYQDSTKSSLSLDQFDANGNFLSEHIVPQPSKLLPSLLPKKIFRMKSGKGYYLLGYVIQSINLINGIPVYSTPVIIRLDQLLNPVWVQKLHFAAVTTANANALIEYNDLIEATNGDVIIAGRYSPAPAGQQINILATRLTAAGAIVWNYQYSTNFTCNANALALTEATDNNIILTGYVELCTSGFGGPRQVLFLRLQPSGIPVTGFAYLGATTESAGTKIVKRTNVAGNDAFFISGFVDVTAATGAPNRQVLIIDVRESGAITGSFHVGDAGTEESNDLVIRNLGNENYYLYLTGFTTSYYTAVSKEVFYLQLRYVSGTLGLVEFSTFPQTASYTERYGLEIKAAGKDKFAILANANYIINGTSNTSTFTNVLLRDLSSASQQCIKLHQPPVSTINFSPKQLEVSPKALSFKPYAEKYTVFQKVFPKLLCGQFNVNAYDALNSGVIEQRIATPNLTLSKVAPVTKPETVSVYPNPASNYVFIEYRKPITSKVQAKVFGPDMRLLKIIEINDNNRKTLSLDGLPSGLYFIQVGDNNKSESFKIMKN
ncbi:T9SS type A sorting domain-containing protein [Chitinophaga ginsengisoli]|uniref:Putative secreted protein (Por secretion system target) n=1 Tax=Chitinophaga ginsengisoli TaxID=363837 RepID=A0A2P8GKL7_9BACT|nr:T9SS type A sorting domain-containing protein [Chitinophaga ginsengisoli]PSL34517.1 putative secreted protein (Por secretion system target) [Chitinophaga ginsengisoli]